MTEVWVAEPHTSRHLAFDLAAAAVFTLFTVAVAAPEQRIVAALLGVALALRSLSWPLMAATGVLAGLLQLRLGSIHLFADLAYAPLFFTLGANRDRNVRRFGLFGAVATVVVAAVAGGTGRLFITDPPSRGAFDAAAYGALTALVVGGGWLGGRLRHQSRAAVQAHVDERLRLQAAEAEQLRLRQLYDLEQERVRIAADMHDVVAHSWAVVAAQADGARYTIDQPERAAAALAVIGETARAAMVDLRTILARLRHEASGNTSAPGRAHVDALLARMRASGMTIEVAEQGTAPSSTLVALTTQRLLGEALTNALKYGDLDAPVRVVQDWRDGARLEVRNRVDRRRAPAEGRGTGHGLVGMSERAALAGGTLSAGPEGDEWVVRCTIAELDPLDRPPTSTSAPLRQASR